MTLRSSLSHTMRHAMSRHVQVALMFLVKGEIPTEAIWTAFIASAAELTLRRTVPPTRPSPPQLFPELKADPNQLKSKCWAHGGAIVPLTVPPRPKFKGASASDGFCKSYHAHRRFIQCACSDLGRGCGCVVAHRSTIWSLGLLCTWSCANDCCRARYAKSWMAGSVLRSCTSAGHSEQHTMR